MTQRERGFLARSNLALSQIEPIAPFMQLLLDNKLEGRGIRTKE